jgi:hypothetical protein
MSTTAASTPVGGHSSEHSGAMEVVYAAPKAAGKLAGRDGIEPPTPGFSDLSLGIANDAKVLAS